jgi:hypothetical protein
LKLRISRTVRKTMITIILLLVLFIGAGVTYVLITDRSTNKHELPPVSASLDQSPLPKAVAPGPNAPEGVGVELVTSPVTAGSNASITVSTNAGSACTITVSYNGVKSSDSGLVPKVADAYGNVTWTWTVISSVPAGTWPINVSCVYHGRTGVVTSSYQVTA